MLSTGGPATVARWKHLGLEAWTIPSLTRRKMTVWTASKDEWKRVLSNMDDEDEYKENIWGFLTVANNPHIVGRKKPPPHISDDAAGVAYENTIERAPTTRRTRASTCWWRPAASPTARRRSPGSRWHWS
jgi:hypothetical protein